MTIPRSSPMPCFRVVRHGVLPAVLCLALHTLPSYAQEAEKVTTYTLAELVARALQHNPTVQEHHWKTAQASADLNQARAARFLPRLRLESVGGLVPDAKGDIFNPPADTSGLKRSLGPFSQTELEFVQPIYTFGLLSSLRDAAAAGVEVAEAAGTDAQLGASLEVKELYYGLLLARELDDLVTTLSKELARRREDLDLDDPELPLSTRYKLELATLELEGKRRQLDTKLHLARATLAWRCGFSDDEHWNLQADHLAKDSTRVPALDSLAALAAVQRPEWRQLKAGIVARQAQEAAATAAFYPQFFLAGGLRYGIAPGRTDQHNPFAVDNFNFSSLGMFVGVQQSFEWGILGAKRDKARAQRLELKSQERAAAAGIRLDVTRAYGDVLESEAGLESAGRSRTIGKHWIQEARDEYEFTEEAEDLKDLVAAFESLAETEQGYHQAVYDYNVALARLERAVGVAFTPPPLAPLDRRSD
jgi:outer membrane protein